MPKRKSAIRKKAKEKTTLQKQKQKQNVAQSVKVVVNLAARRRAAARKSPSGAPKGRAPPSQLGSQPQVRTTSTQPIVSGNISDETRRAIMLEGVNQANQERAVLLEMERKANTLAEEQRKATEQATVPTKQKTIPFKRASVIKNPLQKVRAPYGSLKKAREETEARKKIAMAVALQEREESFTIQSPQQNISRGAAFSYQGVNYSPPPRPESIATTLVI